MRNIKIVFTLLIFASPFSCHAQQTIMSMYEMEQCGKRPDKSVDCPGFENVEITHVKDVNNRLNAFDGTWIASYNGKQYEMKLEKKVDYKDEPSDTRSWDRLLGKLRVKNSQGNILFDSFSKPDNESSIWGDNFQNTSYVTLFSNDTVECNDYGTLFLDTPKLNLGGNPTITVQFFRDTGEIWDNFYATCPNFDNYQTTFPDKIKITFTKQ